mmetsp:Transcript_11989/g.20978  ORF Transcript_11989/g.20978 Transcript_11989/m.20978 type:complete len:1000 (-) Transcript_11989:38-3037(-)
MVRPLSVALLLCFSVCGAAPCTSTAPDSCAREHAGATELQGLLQTRVAKAKKQENKYTGFAKGRQDQGLEKEKQTSKKEDNKLFEGKDHSAKDEEESRDGWGRQRRLSFHGDADMHPVLTYDYIVVGAGTGGMAAAQTLADRGAHVAVFEGGTDESFRLMHYAWQEPGTENARGEPMSHYMPTKVFADTQETKPIGDGGANVYGIPYAVGGTASHYHGVNFWYDIDVKHGLEMDDLELTDLLTTVEDHALPHMKCGTAIDDGCARATHNISTLKPRFILNRPVRYNVCMHGKCKRELQATAKDNHNREHADCQGDTCDVNRLLLNQKSFTSFNGQMKDWFRVNTFYEYKHRRKSPNTVDVYTEKEVIGLAVNGSFACAREWTQHARDLKDKSFIWRGCQEYIAAIRREKSINLDGVRIKDKRKGRHFDIRATKAVILAAGVMGDASLLWPIMGEYTWVDQTFVGDYANPDFQCDENTAFGSTVHMVRCFNKSTETTYDCQLHEKRDSVQCGVDDHLPDHIDYKTETRGVYMYYTGCKVSGQDRFIYYAVFNSDPRIEGVVKHDIVEDHAGKVAVTFKAVINEAEPRIVEEFRNQTKYMFSKLDQKYAPPSNFDDHFDKLGEDGVGWMVVHWTGGFGDEIQKSKVKGFSNFFIGDALANRGVTHSWTSFTARSAGVVAAQRAFKQFGSSKKQSLVSSSSRGIQLHLQNDDTMYVAGSAKKMPLIGFGTCCRASAKGQPLVQSTLIYLNSGGRLIDTAQMYDNHRDLAKAIHESGVPREELWVTSKLNTATNEMRLKKAIQTEEDAMQNVDACLEELGLEYLDLLLIHGAWDNPVEVQESIWRGLIAAKTAGKVMNIGVSNFNRAQIQNLKTKTGVLPAAHELEYHPWVPRETHDLVRWCQDEGIAVTAYGSLGGSKNAAESEAAQRLANKYDLSKAQVLLSWALNKGVAVIPGATSQEHIEQNLATPVGLLSEDDMNLLESSGPPESWRRWHNCESGCPT